jgi:hypothetical protein
VARKLADPKMGERIMPLRNALMDLHGSIIRMRGMDKEDPQSNVKLRELAGYMRKVVQIVNRSPTGLPPTLSNAYSALSLAERQPEMAMIYVRQLYNVASDYLVFNAPPASPEIPLHSSPPGPFLAAS